MTHRLYYYEDDFKTGVKLKLRGVKIKINLQLNEDADYQKITVKFWVSKKSEVSNIMRLRRNT